MDQGLPGKGQRGDFLDVCNPEERHHHQLRDGETGERPDNQGAEINDQVLQADEPENPVLRHSDQLEQSDFLPSPLDEDIVRIDEEDGYDRNQENGSDPQRSLALDRSIHAHSRIILQRHEREVKGDTENESERVQVIVLHILFQIADNQLINIHSAPR